MSGCVRGVGVRIRGSGFRIQTGLSCDIPDSGSSDGSGGYLTGVGRYSTSGRKPFSSSVGMLARWSGRTVADTGLDLDLDGLKSRSVDMPGVDPGGKANYARYVGNCRMVGCQNDLPLVAMVLTLKDEQILRSPVKV